jgi:di/tricarboxylate transporter
MTIQTAVLGAALILALVLFVWGRWKPEVVALALLLALTVAGVVPAEAAFDGFAHPAVITVGAILVVSATLSRAGVVEAVARPLERLKTKPLLLLLGLLVTVAALSSFMNNVGALALLMPVAIRLARDSGRPASAYLMPLAFASLLGGMTTLIGTPPNLIVSGFRAAATGAPLRFFDFAPVGLPVAAAGIVALALLARRLVPTRTGAVSSDELFKVGPYLTEAAVPAGSPAVGSNLRALSPTDVQVLSIVRDDGRIIAPSPYRPLREGDQLVMMGQSEAIEKFIKSQQLELIGQAGNVEASLIESDEAGLAEAVVSPGSRLIGGTAASLRLRERHGINLIGIAREGARIGTRLGRTRFRAGDVLLVQGERATLYGELEELGCLPLADRALGIGMAAKRLTALTVFGGAIALVATGVLSPAVGFSLAALLMVVLRVITVRQAYSAIDWPVLILLAAMIPVGLAIESTGLATLISGAALGASQFLPDWAMIAAVLLATMLLSDIVNNAAAAVMMCPVALAVASGLGTTPDAFLLAVAIGASCAFLTPIGHQSNLLVMGPAGYRFGDYWRLGLFLELTIALVAVPLLMIVWHR